MPEIDRSKFETEEEYKHHYEFIKRYREWAQASRGEAVGLASKDMWPWMPLEQKPHNGCHT